MDRCDHMRPPHVLNPAFAWRDLALRWLPWPAHPCSFFD
jgi:hypothetical protein